MIKDRGEDTHVSTIYATLMGGEHDQHLQWPIFDSQLVTSSKLGKRQEPQQNATIYILGFSPTILSVPLQQEHLISTR